MGAQRWANRGNLDRFKGVLRVTATSDLGGPRSSGGPDRQACPSSSRTEAGRWTKSSLSSPSLDDSGSCSPRTRVSGRARGWDIKGRITLLATLQGHQEEQLRRQGNVRRLAGGASHSGHPMTATPIFLSFLFHVAGLPQSPTNRGSTRSTLSNNVKRAWELPTSLPCYREVLFDFFFHGNALPLGKICRVTASDTATAAPGPDLGAVTAGPGSMLKGAHRTVGRALWPSELSGSTTATEPGRTQASQRTWSRFSRCYSVHLRPADNGRGQENCSHTRNDHRPITADGRVDRMPLTVRSSRSRRPLHGVSKRSVQSYGLPLGVL